MTHKPSHNPALFDQYIQYDGPEGEGFRIAQSDSSTDIYIVDDYGGWVDKELNYYDRDGEPAGYFDQDYNFYDMNGYRIPGGYKGGKTIEREIKKKQKYLDSVPDNSKQKFVVEIQNLPPNTVPIQIINYILERCNLKQGEIEECKKVQKQATKGYVVVTGADKVQKLLILEGRKFRLQEKDGKYTSNEIQIFVREAKFNNGKQFSNNSNYSKNNQQEQVEQEDDGYKIAFENLDSKKTNQEFINWIVSQTNCKIDEFELKRPNQKPSGQLLLQNENLMYLILKQNGRQFGDSPITFKQISKQ
ncbi:unnamed protein product (macronuclear) [Paramecium tetraurelia]|uniref:RRM domain-containing protein n=1 Tax=Paramecium tetraurelia TaxID=5888 RepID=A0E586_PARTE|nr:uncharacterized protein GSPATT00023630001 [Paramecium tetraurelia]CAK90453.1 unnamed protein product [Paramecium tetraurelia]|eukprot:XP_001457850.1 hypothetical protein (macronuclear) [Paramecium tetraurelia strain d4-2]